MAMVFNLNMFSSKVIILPTILVAFFLTFDQAVACNRKPPANVPHSRQKQPGDNGYRIIIGEDPVSYIPGKIYNLFLLGSRTHDSLQQFTHFRLNAQQSSGSDPMTSKFTRASPRRVGRFQLFSDALTKFSEDCVNTVSEADNLPKTEIQVMWVAPKTGSGCVALSAMVLEDEHHWYADDKGLTKIICEITPDEIEREKQKELGDAQCCACDEAKYNFVFEGIWSNETHPRDYPFAIWLTHFSDVIGATHDTNFSFWGENHIATDGFRSLAEWGSVRLMETELRAKGPRLRTLIKAAGLWFPHVNTNTSSQFRADRVHHKLSLVSMFGPSPDWVVGVNGLNLCKPDCTWENSFDIDLYPWDAGTDNGITYMSPNAETQPRERMYKITTMYPEDPRQPFYNSNGSEMTPLARLYIRKVKQIPQNCDVDFLQAQVLDISENTEEGEIRPECGVTEFTEWAPCSVTCGKGIRMRSRQYLHPQQALDGNCNRQLVNKEMCVADIPECENTSADDDDDEENLAQSVANTDEAGEGVGVCRTTPWSEYSPCSATCGIGISMKTRTFIDHAGRKKCPHISIVEKEKCMKPECSAADMEIPDPMCPVTQWSDWSPCSATCGNGVRIRTRLLLIEHGRIYNDCTKRMELYQQEQCATRADCIFDVEIANEICAQIPEVGPCRGVYNRFAYDDSQKSCIPFIYGGCRGNQNNFLTIVECQLTCQRENLPPSQFVTPRPTIQPIETYTQSRRRSQQHRPTPTPRPIDLTAVDCVVSEWTNWTECSVECGRGFSERSRNIIIEPQNEGRRCPKKMVERKRCTIFC